VADITNPARPRRTAFIESPGFGYVTEGLHALHLDTPSFEGDILVVSNEWCRASPDPENMPGGISIYDITDPEGPKPLVEAFGDFDLYGNRANQSHSAIAWDAGGRAFVAAIDNEEIEDVDLFEITDPRNPVLLSETRLPGVNVDAYGQEKTSHDYDVLRFPDGSWHLMVSDWDAGWVDVDVTEHLLDMLLFGPGTVEQAVEAGLTFGPLQMVLHEAPAPVVDAVRAALIEELAPWHDGTGVRMPGAIAVVSARRP
jgi:hypothetical protein